MINPLEMKSPIGGMLENARNGLVGGGNPNPGRIEVLLVTYLDGVFRNDRKARGLTDEEVMVMFYRYFGSQAFETYDRVVNEEKLKLVEYDEGDYTFLTDSGEEMTFLKQPPPKDNKVLVTGVRRKLLGWDVIGRMTELSPRQARSRFESGRRKVEEND